MPPLAEYALLAAAGFLTSILNVLAGGGSFLTLPLLIFLGLPAAEANGTNRLGILAQNISAVWGFHRARVVEWRFGLWTALPAVVGSVIGAWVSLQVGEMAFRRVLATLMLAMTFVTLADPRPHPARRGLPPWLLGALFLALGFYGGFVQAGIGFLLLAVTTWAGLDLVRGNAVKVLNVLIVTIVAGLVFAASGKIRWDSGLALAAGSVVGGMVGVRITVRKGERFVRWVVVTALVVFAVRLWMS